MPPQPQISTLNEAVEAVYNLNVGVIGTGSGRHERPHKPCLLFSVFDLIASGNATPDRIIWNQTLRDRFAVYFEVVRTPLDQCSPDLPFYHMESEGWWQAVRISNAGMQPLQAPPSVADAHARNVTASLVSGIDRYELRPEDRLRMRDALITRYFPHKRSQLVSLFTEGPTPLEPTISPDVLQEEEPSPSPGRNAAFRKKILEIYDCQCAACGIRIKLLEIGDLTIVDAAHLIPFSLSFNDHPTNGIALCKNHHWAMDRFLIAPSPQGDWIVSKHLDERRSEGERALLSSAASHSSVQPNQHSFRPSTL
jgi:putative restriction endonuclease